MEIEFGSWNEIENDGDETETKYIDVDNVRIFYRRYDTKPDCWEITGFEALGEVDENTLRKIESNLNRFNKLDDSFSKRIWEEFKNKNLTPNLNQQIYQDYQIIKPSLKLNNLVILNTLAKNFVITKQPKLFKNQMNLINKSINNPILFAKKIPGENIDFETWLTKYNLDVYKQWMNVHQLIKKIRRRK